MLDLLQAFGIKDKSIISDREKLKDALQLNVSENNVDNKTLVSTIVTLVDVVYSIQTRLMDLETAVINSNMNTKQQKNKPDEFIEKLKDRTFGPASLTSATHTHHLGTNNYNNESSSRGSNNGNTSSGSSTAVSSMDILLQPNYIEYGQHSSHYGNNLISPTNNKDHDDDSSKSPENNDASRISSNMNRDEDTNSNDADLDNDLENSGDIDEEDEFEDENITAKKKAQEEEYEQKQIDNEEMEKKEERGERGEREEIDMLKRKEVDKTEVHDIHDMKQLNNELSSDNESEGFEYDDVIINSGDEEGDLDDDLDPKFDEMTASDKTQHAIPINFTYNYKPQQITTLKIPANISEGEKSIRPVAIVNWKDIPLSQVAMKYNVSKSVIGPTLQVMRDFEKKNNKTIQELVKRNRERIEKQKHNISLKDKSDSSNVDNVAMNSNKPKSKPVKGSKVNLKDSKKSVSDAQKVRLRLRKNRRRNRDSEEHEVSGNTTTKSTNNNTNENNMYHDDESSSESVYDPNYRSDEENEEEKSGNSGTSDLLLKEEANKQNTDEKKNLNKRKSTEVDEEKEITKKVKLDERSKSIEIENEREKALAAVNNSQLSSSLYSLLQSSTTERESETLVPSIKLSNDDDKNKDLTDSITMKNNGNGINGGDDGIYSVLNSRVNDTSVNSIISDKSDDQVPSFAYEITVDGRYRCKTKGCDVEPFSQYIQLYKHKSLEHPEELP